MLQFFSFKIDDFVAVLLSSRNKERHFYIAKVTAGDQL